MPTSQLPHDDCMVLRVAVLAFEGCQPLDVVGPFDVFTGARQLQAQRRTKDLGYETFLVTPGGAPIRGQNGLRLVPDLALESLSGARAVHTLLVAGGFGAREASRDPALMRKLARAARAAARVASVCTGAFALCAAGLCEAKRVTTHWAYCEQLAQRFPTVRVEPDPIYVRDGKLWTSAGVTAGIDLALALVEHDLGHEVAAELSRWLVMFIRRSGGQSQFSAPLAAQVAEPGRFRDLLAHVAEHPEAELSVPKLARRAGMSVRHFSRVFHAECGFSPAEYVERVRVETARRLLEGSELSVEAVAERAGFGGPEGLRRAFARRVGVAPKEYRARFASRRA